MQQSNHSLINFLSCGYLSTSSEGRITFANQYLLNLLQVTGNEFAGEKYLLDLFPDEEKERIQTWISPLPDHQKTIEEISTKITRFDHSNISVLLNATVERDSKGEVETIHYTLFDNSSYKPYKAESVQSNTEKQQLTADLNSLNSAFSELSREFEKKNESYKRRLEIYEKISEVGKIGSWEQDLNSGQFFCSAMSRQILQIDEVNDWDLSIFINYFREGESRNRIAAGIQEAMESGSPYGGDLQLRTAKGHETWVKVRVFAEREADKTVRLYGTFQDTSQQKKLLLQLQESHSQIQKDNAYYKSIVENQTFYIMKTDVRGRYTYLNAYLCEALNIKAEDWLGKNSLGLVFHEDHELCAETVKKCFENPDKMQRVILRKDTKRGMLVTQWEFSLLHDDSNASGIMCIGHDITPLIKKQEDLQNFLDITALQNKRLNDFNYIISHNIRTHVANLSGLLSITDLDDESNRNMSFGLLKNSVDALDETISHLNEIVSIQSNTNLPESDLNLNNEINKVLQIIQIQIASSNTAVYCRFSNREELRTNPAYLESIVLNLLTNSIKYKSPNRDPEIIISLKRKGKYKILTISDNGLGIDLNKHEDSLFGMFNTFHGNEDAKGLGLFIIKAQVEALGGKIEVESKVNEGTTFNVYFPDNI